MTFSPPRIPIRRLLLAFSAVATCVGTLLFYPAKVEAAPDKSKIYAVYKIYLSGFSLGKFKILTKINQSNYSMTGNGKVKLFQALFLKWQGSLSASGQISADGPEPKSYNFYSKYNSKVEKLKMNFVNNAVSDVEPAYNRSGKRVKIIPEQLVGVLDPLSALMQLTKSEKQSVDGRSICSGTIPVFDGESRFDVRLSYKRAKKIQGSGRNSFSGRSFICRAKYIPISGHRPDRSNTKFMAETNGIEVWMASVPKANLFVPYRIVLPTPIGEAVLESSEFQIENPEIGSVALSQ